MQTTYTFWTWLDGYCVEQIKKALETSEPTDHWIGMLARHVRMLLETRGPPRELRSSDFGAAALDGRYTFQGRHSFDPVSVQDITNTVIDILASWLNFPIGGKPGAVHSSYEVFGKLAGPTPSPVAYARLTDALQNCALAQPASEARLVIQTLDELITEYRKRRTTVEVASPPPQIQGKATATPKRIAATSRRKRAEGPPLLLTLADDAMQLQNMDRFLRYLLELEPLIDGHESIANPTPLQSRVNSRRDFLLPFREHGPSRVKSRGPAAAFDRAHCQAYILIYTRSTGIDFVRVFLVCSKFQLLTRFL
ncbi:hypothetical protein DFH06DRAFT_1121228 [Mycena polygramma]|nr:hypothetical protein DFH06DRAFT_1121228 [Mycena polygramma]